MHDHAAFNNVHLLAVELEERFSELGELEGELARLPLTMRSLLSQQKRNKYKVAIRMVEDVDT
jgi:hypothetical protein